jgi:hypothetical protein
MAKSTRRRSTRAAEPRRKQEPFEPIVFPGVWVTDYRLQAAFFVFYSGVGFAFARLGHEAGGWALGAAGLMAWAALLSLYAAVQNRRRREPGRIAKRMFFVFPVVLLVLLAGSGISRSAGT